MKLYINQHVFTIGASFAVRDEAGQEIYQVEGEIFTLGRRLHVCDRQEREVLYLRQEVPSFLRSYQVIIDGREVACIRQDFALFHHRFYVEGPGWDVEGEFLAHEYAITCGSRTVATISKEWMTWGDSYELNVANPADALTALAVVLAIDCVLASSKN